MPLTKLPQDFGNENFSSSKKKTKKKEEAPATSGLDLW
jgi:hypothetical protein